MGNQNNSVARKRLSTLAITTTLAAVGVGVVGTGAANAATGAPLAHSQDNSQAATAAAAVKVAPGTGSSSLTATADLTGTKIDPTDATAKVTIDWSDGNGPQAVDLTATGLPTTSKLTNTYAKAGTYNVVVSVKDGATTLQTSKASVTVTDATLVATLKPSDTTKKNSPVILSLAGSSVDASVAKTAMTTVSWGDKSQGVSFLGDPAKLDAKTVAKLAHSYAADGSYTITVKLDDGLGTKTSVSTQMIDVTVREGAVVSRASGNDRYGTGIDISKAQWANHGVTTDKREQAKSVVLATGNDFADALVGVPLAKKAVGPLLLTDGLQTTTNPQVLAEIKRILPTTGSTVYILGGEKALNAGIESQLKALGYNTKRLAGEDRFATSVKIAQVGLDDPSHIIVARGDEGENGNGFADALAAGPYAANVWGGGDSAVVLSNFNTFDPATAAYVTSKLHAGQKDVAAIGGQATAAMGTIKGSTGLYDFTVGATRYETAAQVAAAYEPKAKNLPVGVATGMLFPDALTGGAYMATINGPLLLTDPLALSPATKAEISAVALSAPSIDIFGGEKAITPAVAKAIAALAGATSIGKF